MLKGRGRAQVLAHGPAMPAQNTMRRSTATVSSRAPLARPEPDYEVVEFPTEQYVNAKIQPPPPPPRPPTGHPIEASCGLCGGGGARVRCAECGRRALCASCDDMYHRHPKRRHHQRQAISPSLLREERPPLPPKSAAPVPPPRRHKISGDRSTASPRPQDPRLDQRRGTLSSLSPQNQGINLPVNNNLHFKQQNSMPNHFARLQATANTPQLGSVPYLPAAIHQNTPVPQMQNNTLGHPSAVWNRPRGSLQGFNFPPNIPVPAEPWDTPGNISPSGQNWGRPLRRGASVLELGGGPPCPGCAHCGPLPWRYGSCANLDHPWISGWPPTCCPPPHSPVQHTMSLHHHHQHPHPSQTPQPYRRAESRAVSRAASRIGSRAASPAVSIRSRTSRRTKHRTPSPVALPSSDADSESEDESDHIPPHQPNKSVEDLEENSLGPVPSLPNASWQCEHCTFVNEPGVRVCTVCCRTPTVAPKVVAENISNSLSKMTISVKKSSASIDKIVQDSSAKQDEERAKTKSKKERTSTGCGPSPPRDTRSVRPINRLETPTRESTQTELPMRHDMAVGSSPPREVQIIHQNDSPPASNLIRADIVTPQREENKVSSQHVPPTRHSVSVGPSPPRDTSSSVTTNSLKTEKVSIATSTPLETMATLPSLITNRARVSNTGTSPPPQSISTQTYEDPNTWDRAPSATRSRPQRRRFKDDGNSERSHSRHSLSSDTRESDRSARTSGGRWEWREPRDSSPGGDWSENEKRRAASRLTRRASHLDLRRTRSTRRSSHYGSEAASPEPLSVNRTISLEALTGSGVRREAEKGLELARLLSDAERLGFSAAEVHAALAQNPVAPLSWLRERWPSLCAGVRAAAARLAPGINVSELEARAALAKHRGAMWPAVTECVEKHRRQSEIVSVGEERRLRGHVWGSPVGADDDAAPPHRTTYHSHRMRAEDSSDEFDVPTPNKSQDDDWMYLPLETQFHEEPMNIPVSATTMANQENNEEIAQKLKELLSQAGVPAIDEKLLLRGLLADSTVFKANSKNIDNTLKKAQNIVTTSDLGQSENDFIDAYNALTRLSPLPNINMHTTNLEQTDETATMHYDQKSVDHSTNTLNNISVSNSTTVEMAPIFNEEKQIHQDNTSSEVNMRVEETNNRTLKTDKVFPTNLQKQTIKKKFDKNEQPSIAMSNNVFNKYENSKTSIIKQKSSTNKTNIHQLSKLTSKTSEQSKIVTESELETFRQNEEKSNNLSDIVDNTQKLIQQMKEEINSDINSLDDSNMMSQSEAENSANDSEFSTEHESSYSDTEQEETDELSSERHDSSNSENEGENKDPTKNNTATMNRTSSEDNEQFEEAMDHLEGQLDDFKQTNIEMLDSIARSLQEEHTLSVQVSDLNTSRQKRQDFNNNFSKVTSFEEIYEELLEGSEDVNYNSHSQDNQSSQKSQEVLVENTQTTKKNIQKKNELLQAKKEIHVNVYKAESPKKFIITENKKLALNALIENNIKRIDYVHTMPTKSNNPINLNHDIHNNLQSENTSTSMNIQISSPFKITPQRKDNDFGFIDNTTYDSNIRDEGQQIVKTISDDSLQYGETVESSNMEDTLTDSLNINNSDIQQSVSKLKSENNNDISENGLLSNKVIPIENEHFNSNLQKTESRENTPENEFNDSQMQNISSNEIQVSKDSNHANDVSDPPFSLLNENAIANDKSVITTNKSNIPKLIKSLQNDKIKTDKHPPTKNINSKLPVRRTSTKQYAAPAPPKAHFGNIQSGHVKHLQTRLFNNKSNAQINQSTTEPIPTTSYTLNKKKPAPPPPLKNQDKQKTPSPPEATPQKEKKSYFRETCRTEDEWTESDSEGTPPPFIRSTEESEPAPASPPPPITLRRVSGQLIDLAKVRLPEGSPERQARMLLAEGATENWEQARLAVELVSRGTDPPVALMAALECIDLNSALAYLQQDCELCASRFPEHEMVSMLRCTHRCCRECARHYFTVQITERSIADCICPYCKEPELETLPEDAWLEYFAHLDILLKTLLEAGVHELFQRKLRDRTLARDPNFRWCVECSSGFFVHPKQKKLRCPECRSVSCASCRKPWSSNHDGLTCEQYAAWLEDNDTEKSAAAVQQHLRENGLECPRCRFKYSLSRGGCMHFTCTQCKYEFCYGCDKPFMMGAQCGLSEYCAKLGLHAHHPRNCLFYLRDKEPHELQTLLQMNNVTYETEAAEGGSKRCPIQLQRETPTGLVDGACGGETPPHHAGLCKSHYVEYLAGLARGLDPIPIMEVSELVAELRRRALPLPERGPWDTDPIYAGMCAEIVKEKIPLD